MGAADGRSHARTLLEPLDAAVEIGSADHEMIQRLGSRRLFLDRGHLAVDHPCHAGGREKLEKPASSKRL
jgi:hypothetical protein